MKTSLAITAAMLPLALLGAGPKMFWPSDNKPTADRVQLGRTCFYSNELSVNRNISCSSCHDPAYSFTDRRPLSVGSDGSLGKRHSISLLNVGYLPQNKPALFRDIHALGCENQIRGPVENPLEMSTSANPQTLEQCAARVDGVLHAEFVKCYGTGCNATTLSQALSSFERALVVTDTPEERYDRGQTFALSGEEVSDRQAFIDAGCAACHKLPDGRDGLAHRIGVLLADRTGAIDNGAGGGAFQTPHLLAVSLHPPYGHAGQWRTVPQAIAGHTLLKQPSTVELAKIILFLGRPMEPVHYPTIGPGTLP